MNEDNKNGTIKRAVLIVLLTISVIAIGVGATYAYFAAAITQGVSSKIYVQAIQGLSITFADADGNTINMPDAMPGDSKTKNFTVTFANQNVGYTIKYDLKLHANASAKPFTTEQSTAQSPKTGRLLYKVVKSGSEVGSLGTFSGTAVPITEEGASAATNYYVVTALNNTDQTLMTGATITSTKNGASPSYNLAVTFLYENEEAEQVQGAIFDGYLYFVTTQNSINTSTVTN